MERVRHWCDICRRGRNRQAEESIMKRRRESKYGDDGELDNAIAYSIAVMVLYWMRVHQRPLDNSVDPKHPSACDEVSRHFERIREEHINVWHPHDLENLLRASDQEELAHLSPAERERELVRQRRILTEKPGGVWNAALKVSQSRARKCYSHFFGRGRSRQPSPEILAAMAQMARPSSH
jgi:hypothetical protein